MVSVRRVINYLEKNKDVFGDHYSFVREYIEELMVKNRSPHTIYQRLITLKDYYVFSRGEISKRKALDFIYMKTRNKLVPTYSKRINHFFKWLYENGYVETLVRVPVPKKKKKIYNVLTEEEVINIVAGIRNPKYQLLFALLYETGARISELLNIKIRDVERSELVSYITIRKSKSEPRKIMVVLFNPLLLKYIESFHRYADDPESYLFYSVDKYKHVTIPVVWYFFKKLSEKYNRKIHPHLLRHSRGTHLIKMGLTEKEVMLILGEKTREMIDVYVNISGRDVNEKLMEIYGIQKRKNIETIKCPVCGHVNPAGTKRCLRCGRILSPEEALKEEQYIKELIKKQIEETLKERYYMMEE